MTKLHITFKNLWTGKHGLAVDWNYHWYFQIGFGEKTEWGKK